MTRRCVAYNGVDRNLLGPANSVTVTINVRIVPTDSLRPGSDSGLIRGAARRFAEMSGRPSCTALD
jgi:hypothetical protein